jgi:CubicO group peptidase (beta-lactamase class C family)
MRTIDVDVSGDASESFEPLVNVFARTVAYTGGRGASLAVYRGGEKVVDLIGGDYQADSLQLQLSVSKLVTAITAAHAGARGLLDVDEPISAFWSAFDRDRTRQITARMVLSHTAGLAGISTELTLEQLLAGQYLREIERQDPYWEPGSRPGYHAFAFGALMDEIFRRRVGSSVGDYFDAEIRKPLGLEVWFGAPQEELSRVMPFIRDFDGRTPLARALPSLRTFADNGARSVSEGDHAAANRPDVLMQGWPNRNVVATSRDLARLLAATLGTVDGHRVLSESTRDAMVRQQSAGVDWVLRYPIRFGTGVQLPFPQLTFTGPNSFGHQGGGGCVAFADIDRDIAVAYSTDAFPPCFGASLHAVAMFSTIQYLCDN